ncbi:ABC transporter substrate-binding protein [Cellulomonas sp. KRMCY2]|uniref:ABC transporter substrate-binding protein n=1 Tax=Cellulomonas sp. KRMCY2 TaxID=1304865 RepID=UPI0004B1C871|nr:NrtA/SsuA/CpmA family ABC transporter substrate-binding protein [Cellulomonas sp. KRMCY2]
MLKKTLAFAAAAAVSLGALAGCTAEAASEAPTTPTVSQAPDAPEAPTVDEVTITYVTAPLNVPSITERELGTFADAFGQAGVDVAYAELTTGPEQTAALASGDIQLLFAVGATSVILSAANGADIAIVDMYSRSPEAFMLVSGPDGPTSPADLVGRTVGGPKGTILHELLLAYLATGGYTADDIDFVDMTIPDAQAALAGGSLDVALLAGPAAATMLSDGFQKVTDGSGLVGATIVVATTREFADANPAIVRTFREAHQSVLDYMDAHPDEVVGMAAAETGLPEAAVRDMVGMYDFSTEVTDADIAAMSATVDFMVANGMIEEAVDVESLILGAE